ncbi:hypothetical protein DLJ49_16250 [Rhodovulum sp. 12E13]|uniref:DUF6639 family protein n=1 Tax=Rhodovulum sp. 12E13 TaxID=2203891 RepID=UPI000E1174C5|nr:DUF6639 family protein [Rhodovulum sp. 12E13]RDC71079.1 hypothetical protein DLJ49_16250 [Rhodovulum sp. 12E13]
MGALADATACGDPMLAVDAPDAAIVERVCTAAMTAKAQLATCGLTQSRAVRIEIVPGIDGPSDTCVGFYQCGTDTIALVPPSAVPEVMPGDSVFATLDPQVYYDSLVVHELAHALMDQAECAHPRCDSDKEYVAYAMQFLSLPESARDTLLSWRERPQEVPQERLNDILLWMKPDIFAFTAWAHFDGLDDGCAFVQGIVRGETTLQLPDFLP